MRKRYCRFTYTHALCGSGALAVVSSIYAVVLNMMQQLGALFTPTGRNVVGLDVRNVHWTVRPSPLHGPRATSRPLILLSSCSVCVCMRTCVCTYGLGAQPVFEKLADLLGVLITLDEIIRYNDNLQQHWQLYKRYA
jgi:hypothetical protein